MSHAQSILIVDDDTAHRTMLATLIKGWGYTITQAEDGSTAIDAVREQAYDLILMDIRMLKVSGLEALDRIQELNPAIPVILMTAYSSVESAVKAMKNGAYDYLTKPLDFDTLKLTMERAMDHLKLKAENRLLREELGRHFDTGDIIGRTPEMIQLLDTVAQVAPSEATVLIYGESGTGKELIASAIHTNSHRKNGPFVKINCAAITETLLESELFGHEKGAFTGASHRKEGRFLQANTGTLFLDEIGEMPLSMQAKLLRVIQEREITRVGGESVIKIDVRIVAATNRDLAEEITRGNFREDLYYRLNVVNLEMPPLRRRREDIPVLAQAFLTRFSDQNKKSIQGFTPDAMNHLMRHDWPGNIRELMNTIERGVILARSDYLDAGDLPILRKPGAPPADETPPQAVLPSADVSLKDVERETILRTLDAAGGNKSETARRLGITRKTLHKKLKEYGVMP
ncbi:MAG: two-component system response regulator [Deltaproteobacteria bacterium]|nr:MAG: two-component system response regulator [Deltaproteobacteria bacterium]